MSTTTASPSNRGPHGARRAHRDERVRAERRRASWVFRAVSAATFVALMVAIALPSLAPVERPRFHLGSDVVEGGTRVSQVEMLSASEDGTEVVVRMWSGTAREYILAARAGHPDSRIVRRAGSGAPPRPVALVFEGDGLLLARLPTGVAQYRFESHVRLCDADAAHLERTWTLCAVDGGSCINGPSHPLGHCETGELDLVELYEKSGVLWAVVERDVDHARPRMIAGYPY